MRVWGSRIYQAFYPEGFLKPQAILSFSERKDPYYSDSPKQSRTPNPTL